MELPKAVNCSPVFHVKEIQKILDKVVSQNGRSQSSKYFERNLGRAVAAREGLPGAPINYMRAPCSKLFFVFPPTRPWVFT